MRCTFGLFHYFIATKIDGALHLCLYTIYFYKYLGSLHLLFLYSICFYKYLGALHLNNTSNMSFRCRAPSIFVAKSATTNLKVQSTEISEEIRTKEYNFPPPLTAAEENLIFILSQPLPPSSHLFRHLLVYGIFCGVRPFC